MNEARRNEIKDILTRLSTIGLELGQIRMADTISRTRRDAPLRICQDSLMETISLLNATLDQDDRSQAAGIVEKTDDV